MASASSDNRPPAEAKQADERKLSDNAGLLTSPEEQHSWEWMDLLRVIFVAISAAAVWFRWYEPVVAFSVIGIAATLIGGYPIFREAVENIMERRMTMELSMAIALVAALVIREFFTALIITLFVLVAEILEGMTVSRGRRAIGDLLNLLPREAELLQGEQLMRIPLNAVKTGERILIRPGARIPVDGWVAKGNSMVDQSPVTGEPIPLEKRPGEPVYAGSVNQTGVLQIQVSSVGVDTTFGRIVDAVEQAERSRAPVQKIADQLSGYLVYSALGGALITLVVTHNVRSTIAVIIVAGACGIAAGTPLAILGAIGRCARAGVMVKGGLYLEQLAKVDTVVLDKTGTLTFGMPKVLAVRPAPATSDMDLIRLAAIAERDSEHPVARAIVDYASRRLGPISAPESFQYAPGGGVTAAIDHRLVHVGNARFLADQGVQAPVFALQGSRAGVLVAQGSQYLGAILVDDQLRHEATEAVAQMRGMGIRTLLLTGDTAEAANKAGRELWLDEVRSQLAPQQKQEEIQRLQERKKKVAMVGDGINDAPALAQADVGVAMGSGTDVARESANVVLIGNNLLKFTETLRIARHCRSIILQNFCGTLAVDAVGIGLAACGFLTPTLAAFIHVSSEMVFILNAARLLPQAKPRSNLIAKTAGTRTADH
jgi:heavy metal translocating P-type ATPase